MRDIRHLLEEVAAAEEARRLFLAPCVPGSQVRARTAGLVELFRPDPPDFEGWGIFEPAGSRTARLVEEAPLPLVSEYLELLPSRRAYLAFRLKGQSWTAYPANEGTARQNSGQKNSAQKNSGQSGPMVVHLVSDSGAFDPVVIRGSAGAWWYQEPDRRADPMAADSLREAFAQALPGRDLRFPGLTPEMRSTYELAVQADRERFEQAERRQARGRLRSALDMAGGQLHSYRDRGEVWQVEWTDRAGTRHVSAIAPGDLTVISAGICLSGRDRDFDLQSLVGVMEGW